MDILSYGISFITMFGISPLLSSTTADQENSSDPVLVGSIDLSMAGSGTRMVLGDLDGDGRMDVLMKQPDGGIDDRYIPHEVQCLTAFSLEGDLLWQVGTPDPGVRGSGSDIPAQIYDIDQDGCNEVLCVMDDQFRILDGKTGILKEIHELPDPDAHDCIIIANLTGTATKSGAMRVPSNPSMLLWADSGRTVRKSWLPE